MAIDLKDIVPSRRTVRVNGSDVHVPGVSLTGVVSLCQRFPALHAMIVGSSGDAAAGITGLGPDVMAAVIAAGCGSHDDADAEATVCGLNIDAQFDLLVAVLEETLPNGISPLGAKIARAMAILSPSASVPSAPEQQTGKIKIRPRPSRQQPSNSQAPALAGETYTQ